MLHVVRIVALITLVAASAEAQELAGTFDQLQVLVKPGDTLTVTDDAGERIRGKLSQLSTSSLVLNVSGTQREFQSDEVKRIEKRGPDSLKNGALIGLAIGAGIAGLGIAASVNSSDADAGLFVIAGLIYSGIGAGIGVGIDALVEGRRVIYARSSGTSGKLTVVPVFSGPRKGVLVSLRLSR